LSDDLLSRHDVLLADLDGTLYQGPSAVPGAVDAVRGAAERGVRTVYVTNNASRRPSAVAEHLADLGFAARTEDVVASSQAAAAMLAEQLPAGARVGSRLQATHSAPACSSWAPRPSSPR
jgi:ribonucleotide monophosphatase NagD (HAD superfamily)